MLDQLLNVKASKWETKLAATLWLSGKGNYVLSLLSSHAAWQIEGIITALNQLPEEWASEIVLMELKRMD